ELYELRDAGLLKLFFGGDPATLARGQLEAHREKLATYEQQLQECRRMKAPEGIRLALEAGIGHEREDGRVWAHLTYGLSGSIRSPSLSGVVMGVITGQVMPPST